MSNSAAPIHDTEPVEVEQFMVACGRNDLAAIERLISEGFTGKFTSQFAGSWWGTTFCACTQRAMTLGEKAQGELPSLLDALLTISGEEGMRPRAYSIATHDRFSHQLTQSKNLAWLDWGKRHGVQVKIDQISDIVDALRPQMETLDLFDQMGWQFPWQDAAPKKNLSSALFAMALYRGEPIETLERIVVETNLMPRDLVTGVMRHLRHDQKPQSNDWAPNPIQAPQPSSMLWFAAQCQPQIIDKVVKDYFPADGHITYATLSQHFERAQAEAQRQALDDNTPMATSDQARPGPRL